MAAVARLVGVDGATAVPERIDVAVQRDATNEDWRDRFVAEFGGRDVMDAAPGS